MSANFQKIISKSVVCLNLEANDRDGVLGEMLLSARSAGVITEDQLPKFFKAVRNRELSASTAVGDGVALPHGRTDLVNEIICILGISQTGVEFGAPDGQPTQFLAMLLVPTSMGCEHIQFLAQLSRSLLEPTVRHDLLAATTQEEVKNSVINYVAEVN